MYYRANDPGVDLANTVYYGTDYYCSPYIGSTSTRTLAGGGVYWANSSYSSPYVNTNHGCPGVGTGGVSSYYSPTYYINLGGVWHDESWNRPGCYLGGWGTSYGTSITLY